MKNSLTVTQAFQIRSIGFIGGGRITRIMLHGFKNAQNIKNKFYVYEPNTTVLDVLKTQFPDIITSASDTEEAASADLVFIALHPPMVVETLQKIGNQISENAILVSLAPKITMNKIAALVPQTKNIARMNPNAGSYVNHGLNPVCFAGKIDPAKKKAFINLMAVLGEIPEIHESLIEAYAVISAMGHTYFWFQLQQIYELGVSFGLSQKEASEALIAMMEGTIKTQFQAGLTYEQVIDLVPVKPMAEHEEAIREMLKMKLEGIYQKIKP